jgi:hypothetical protein
MNKNIKFISIAVLLAASTTFTSCSDDDDDDDNNLSTSETTQLIDFENTGLALAGPTSYGENLYSSYGEDQFKGGSIVLKNNETFSFETKLAWGSIDFWNGGAALSQWNYRSNTGAEQAASWWCGSQNQCSVYNTASVDGANTGAGHNSSNTFMVIFKEVDFTLSAPHTIESMYVCNSSYSYSSIVNGDDYATSLEKTNGYLKLQAYGYDAEGNATNNGNPVEFYLCDYANNIPAVSTWTKWDLSALGNVSKISISFDGSDKTSYDGGETYYLNTAAYACFDDITIK